MGRTPSAQHGWRDASRAWSALTAEQRAAVQAARPKRPRGRPSQPESWWVGAPQFAFGALAHQRVRPAQWSDKDAE